MSIRSRIANRLHWSVAPAEATPTQRKNFIFVQIDALGLALPFAAGSFLSVFLARLGATNLQIGLLTAMPSFTGLFLSVIMGQFLQSRRNIVPWYSSMRLLVISAYTLTGIVPFVVPQQYVVPTILAIWMAITIPQTLLGVAFTVVMNAVAGPKDRYTLMSRRWSAMGLLKAIVVTIIGQALNLWDFPVNYQLIFIIFSVGGLVSYYCSSHIELPDAEQPPRAARLPLRRRIRDYIRLIRGRRDFLSFTAKQFIFTLGTAFIAPLFPLYYVREVQATDSWIGVINAAQAAILLVGYFLWVRQRRRRGSRFVLLWTTCGLAIYPALVASTRQVGLIALITGLASIFQAGLNLVFFDELMKTVPEQHSPTFVSLAQSLQHLSAVTAPLLGTTLANYVGIRWALVAGAAVCLMGFGLFARGGLNLAVRKLSADHGR